RLKRVLIHTDNLEVAQALRTNTPTISTSALVREANCIADKIAKSVSTDK
ncbi:hypothetical protein Gohar_008210, partial [Gossypium harknessii]|nr:hypothetical protein [Gossypium harknessii]